MAKGSQDPKAISLVPALLNNHAWDLHDMGRLEDALPDLQAGAGRLAGPGQATSDPDCTLVRGPLSPLVGAV